MEILLYIISTLLLIAILVIRNLYIKINKFEQIYNENLELAETAIVNSSNFILGVKQRILDNYIYFKRIDTLGMFESDDEVGHVFIELRSIMEDIKAQFDNIVIDEEDDNESGI